MIEPPSRASWWDDFAALCAGALRAAPKTVAVALVALVLAMGRHDVDLGIAVQVSSGALLAALGLRSGVIRAGPFPLWILPSAAIAMHVLDTSSRLDVGAPFAVAAGAGVLIECVVSGRRLPAPLGALLVWGGLAAARWQSMGGDALSTDTQHLLDLGWPLAIAGSAWMLRGPSPVERASTAPRRAGAGAARWLLWGLAPAIVAALPDPAPLTVWAWQAPLEIEYFAAFVVAALSVRVAQHVVEDVRSSADARARIVQLYDSRPWAASVVTVALAVVANETVRDTIWASLHTSASTPVVYAAAGVWSAYPWALTCGVAALGEAMDGRRRAGGRGRALPYPAMFAVFGVLVLAAVVPQVPPAIVGQMLPLELLSITPWPIFVALLIPLAVARALPSRDHRLGALDVVALLLLLVVPIGAYWGSEERLWPEMEWLTYTLPIAPISVAFQRLTWLRRLRRPALVAGALAGAAASTALLVAIQLDWSDPFAPRPVNAPSLSWANPNQLRFAAPLAVGWGGALLILLFARELTLEPAARHAAHASEEADAAPPEPAADAQRLDDRGERDDGEHERATDGGPHPD